jgi:hypothetical protein
MDQDQDPPPAGDAAADEPAGPDAVEAIREAIACEQNSRAWLASCAKVVETYSREPGRDELVQCALDTLVIAACERGKRILRSDLAD